MALSEVETKKLVSDICERNNATDLLEEFFKNPKEPEFGEKFSDAVNKPILQGQHKTKDRSNLLLPMNRVRFIFASYINSCKNESHMSEAIQALDKSGASRSQRHTYEWVHRSAQDDQLHFRREWEGLVDNKGYPPSWKGMFTKHSKLQMQSNSHSFDPNFLDRLLYTTYQEQMKNLGLRYDIWGEISPEDASRGGINSWVSFWGDESDGPFAASGTGTIHFSD